MTVCPHWDSGWCYHPETPECTPCIGAKECSLYSNIIATDKDNEDD